MLAGGDGLKARIRMRVYRGLERRAERGLVAARLSQIAARGDDGLAELRRLAQGRQPRSWHL
jgi:hypothetical protein